MSETYTSKIEHDMWDLADVLEKTYNKKEVIEYLKGEEFRTFGEGLGYLIKKKDKVADVTVDTIEKESGKKLKKYLEEKCKKNGIDLEKIGKINTFKNWFGNTYPDKTAGNREKIFAIAFALELNMEEAKYLFHKVYFDRAFDYRNYKEAVYYYCIANGYNYERANKIINTIEKKEDKTSIEKRNSLSIAKEIGKIENDDELIDWICSRWSEFQFNNKAAMENFEELFENVKKTAKEEYEEFCKSEAKIEKDSGTDKDEKDKKENTESIKKHVDSDKFIYYVIFGEFPKAKETYFPIIKSGSRIHKELKTNFPTTNYINEFCKRIGAKFKSQEYNKFRKIIILFCFYYFFRNVKKNDKKINFDYQEEFIAEMDELLKNCGLCELYPANPYDFLFILCAGYDYPLDCLRDVIGDLR